MGKYLKISEIVAHALLFFDLIFCKIGCNPVQLS